MTRETKSKTNEKTRVFEDDILARIVGYPLVWLDARLENNLHTEWSD